MRCSILVFQGLVLAEVLVYNLCEIASVYLTQTILGRWYELSLCEPAMATQKQRGSIACKSTFLFPVMFCPCLSGRQLSANMPRVSARHRGPKGPKYCPCTNHMLSCNEALFFFLALRPVPRIGVFMQSCTCEVNRLLVDVFTQSKLVSDTKLHVEGTHSLW